MGVVPGRALRGVALRGVAHAPGTAGKGVERGRALSGDETGG